MKTDIVNKNELIITGPSIRTNFKTAAKEIPAFWQEVMHHRILGDLLSKTNDRHYLYAVYCDYESDYLGDYTMVIGLSCDANLIPPDNMQQIIVPKGKYAHFVAQGEVSQVVLQTWEHIWKKWDKREQRLYEADYERYELSAFASNSKNTTTEIFVGVH